MRRRFIALVAGALGLAAAPVRAENAEHGNAVQMAPLEAYGDLPAVEQMALSPDGKGLAMVTRIEGQRKLLVLDTAGSLKTGLPLADAKIRSLEWCGDRNVCLTSSRTEWLGVDFTKSRYEAYYAAVLPVDGGKPQFVFKGKPVDPPIVRNRGFRTIGGKRFGYFAARALKESLSSYGLEWDKETPALYAVDMETMAVRKIAEPADGGRYRDWIVGSNGEVAAQIEYLDDPGNWAIRSRAGVTLAKGRDKLGEAGLVGLGRDGTSVIYARRDGSDGLMKWFDVPLAGGAESEVAVGVGIRRIYTDPDDGRMLGYLPDSGENSGKPVLFEPALQARLRSVYKAFAKLDVEVEDFTKGVAQVLVRTSGNGDPGTHYLVDLVARKADQVGDERPQIKAEMVGPISVVNYKAADGMEMDGVLTLPPGRTAKNLPVVMMPHGGPFGVDDRPTFDWWAQALASRGYAVFQPNFRGSGHRGDAFEKAGHGQWGGKMQSDISDGLADLARQGIVDPKRACIVGASYGGYAALAGVTLQKGLYLCAVAVAPVSDLADKYQDDAYATNRDPITMRNLNEELGPASGFAAVSPRRHAADADAPVMIIHGKDDMTVPFSQGSKMADALRAAGKPVEFVELEKEDHFLSRAETRKAMLAACVRFVMQHNPPD